MYTLTALLNKSLFEYKQWLVFVENLNSFEIETLKFQELQSMIPQFEYIVDLPGNWCKIKINVLKYICSLRFKFKDIPDYMGYKNLNVLITYERVISSFLQMIVVSIKVRQLL